MISKNEHTNRRTSPPHSKCGGIVLDSSLKKILVVLNRQSHLKGENKWGLPKGHQKPGEKESTCAQRELYEETGLSIPEKRFFRRVNIHHNTYFVLVLKNHFTSLQSVDSKEICKVSWKTPVELRMENLNRDLNILLNYIHRSPLQCLIPYGRMNTLTLPRRRLRGSTYHNTDKGHHSQSLNCIRSSTNNCNQPNSVLWKNASVAKKQLLVF